MLLKIISFGKEEILKVTKENLKKYFTELEPTYVQDGPKVKRLRTFVAKSFTEYQEKTDFSPVVEVGKDKYITIDKVKDMIAS